MDDYIMSRGYVRYEPNSFDYPGIVDKFQKRFDDENGKKYFIDVVKYGEITHPVTGEEIPASYEYEVYLKPKKMGCTIKLLLYAGVGGSDELTEVEEYVESLFNTGLYEYYESKES